MHNKFLLYMVYGLFAFLYPKRAFHSENFPEGKALIVSNHYTLADPCFVRKFTKEPMYFLCKKEAIKNNIWGKMLLNLGALPIDRKNNDIKAMMTAIRELKNGYKLVVFPEGTRNKKNLELQELKGGAGIFAVKSKSPIVPIMLYNRPKVFRKTYYIVGKPFELSEFYDKKLSEDDFNKMNQIIREKMLETRAEIIEIMENRKNKKSKKAIN